MTAGDRTPATFGVLTQRERQRLRLLALRSRVHPATTLRPVADVLFNRRLRHGRLVSAGRIIPPVAAWDW